MSDKKKYGIYVDSDLVDQAQAMVGGLSEAVTLGLRLLVGEEIEPIQTGDLKVYERRLAHLESVVRRLTTQIEEHSHTVVMK